MQTVIIIVHLVIVLALTAVVLLQRSEGGGLGLGGGGGGGVSGFMTGRGQANALTKATAILAALFFVTSLSLAWIASYNRAPSSILDAAPPAAGAPAGPAPVPGGGTFLDQLRQQQGDAPAGQTAPALPAPAAPAQQ